MERAGVVSVMLAVERCLVLADKDFFANGHDVEEPFGDPRQLLRIRFVAVIVVKGRARGLEKGQEFRHLV